MKEKPTWSTKGNKHFLVNEDGLILETINELSDGTYEWKGKQYYYLEKAKKAAEV
jgi:hypothetical protein